MDDEKIIELYWRRDETAIARTDEKYGRLCRKISDDILSSREDSEECVADTYLALWNCIPPQHPSRFRSFIAAVTRNLSLKRLHTAPDGTVITVLTDGNEIYAYAFLEKSYVTMRLYLPDGASDEDIDAALDRVNYSVINK